MNDLKAIAIVDYIVTRGSSFIGVLYPIWLLLFLMYPSAVSLVLPGLK